MDGLLILGVAVVATVIIAVLFQRFNGRFSDRSDEQADAEVLSAQDLGEPLGEHATLVQFSSSFCAPCRATRVLLTDIASQLDGVEAVEIDAESNLELVRRFGIMRTPTTFVLDARGALVTRASGLPQRSQVLAVLAAIPGASEQIVRNVD